MKTSDMMMLFNNDWDLLLAPEFQKPYFLKLQAFLDEEYQKYTIYPVRENIFNALKYTNYQDVKVVIIGQDPYINPNEAHGLAFSVPEGIKLPPSLRNIFKEIEDDLGIRNTCGSLLNWARQGVLLLNATLTVRAGQVGSHRNLGWELFTDEIIRLLNQRTDPIIFLLWGKDAQAKKNLITNHHHFILTAPHPSPLSAYGGFFGCRHFSQVNKILTSLNKTPIDWHTDLRVCFGGSFNPPTKAHMAIIDYLSKRYQKVIIVPNGDQYNRKELIPFKERVAMLNLMLKGYNNVVISDYETNNDTFLGTVQMLRALNHPLFVIGADSLLTIKTWIKYEELIKENHFLVFPRAQINPTSILENDSFLRNYRNHFQIVKDFKELNMSSSDYRYYYSREILTEEVLKYIKDNNLYEVNLCITKNS